jgi:hypothetical protein
MAANRLHELVRRRLWELDRTPEEASRRCRRVLPADTIQRMARRGGASFISEGLVEYLARALDVPQSRVRRAAGLTPVPEGPENVPTRPHLRLVGRDDDG